MRVESDRQDHHSSDAPACPRCALPLLQDATYCPFCECRVRPPTAAGSMARVLRVPSARAFLALGFVFFSLVAVACLVAAIVL